MREERLEILKMVADKTITVDEAERLLRALEEGARAREASRSKDRRGIGASFEALGEVLAEIGPMVRNAVEDAISGVGFGPDEPAGSDFEQVVWEETPLVIAPGSVLEIVQRRMGVRHGARLAIEGVAGEECVVGGATASDVRVYRARGWVQVRWAHGDLAVKAPTTVAKVVARVSGGSILAKALGCFAQLRTMGGTLHLQAVAHPFDARTMGGGITLSLSSRFRGEGKAHTMGGCIAATVPRGVSCAVHAVSTGGTIEIDGGTTQVQRSVAAGRQVVDVSLGEGPVCASLALKTMGGGITVRRVEDE